MAEHQARWRVERAAGRVFVGVAGFQPRLLANHPDAYLAACLVEAALWAADDEQAVRWQARYQAAIDAINNREAKSREAPLRTELPDFARAGQFVG